MSLDGWPYLVMEVELDELGENLCRLRLCDSQQQQGMERSLSKLGQLAPVLAMGGMGMVLEAWDSKLQRKVAIKLWINKEADAELVREAQTLARLAFHPNIVTVFGIGTWGERHYFVMEWIDGHNARDWIEDRTMSPSWREVREVYLAAGAGLAAAHDMPNRPIQHRDFKPSNILVGNDGRVCVADFGIADTIRSSESIAETIAGTMSYMAPERLRGEKGDARSDQFSFCVSMWQALHSRKGELLAEVPPCLLQTLRKGLDRDPDRRFPTMHALLQALAAAPGDAAEGELLETEGYVHAPDAVAILGVTPTAHAVEWSRNIRTTALGLVGGVIGALLVVGAYAGLREPVLAPRPQLKLDAVEAVLAERERLELGLQKLDDANEIADKDTPGAYNLWLESQRLIMPRTPRVFASKSLELAKRIEEHDPGESVSIWIATHASTAFAKVQDWTQAAEAACVAAKVAHAAGADVTAAEQKSIAVKYDPKRPCELR